MWTPESGSSPTPIGDEGAGDEVTEEEDPPEWPPESGASGGMFNEMTQLGPTLWIMLASFWKWKKWVQIK